MAGLNLPWPMLPFEILDRHRLAGQPFAHMDKAFALIIFALLFSNDQPPMMRLRHVHHLMCNHLHGVANTRRGRDGELKLGWNRMAHQAFFAHQHVPRDRNTDRLRGHIKQQRHLFALRAREQTISKIQRRGTKQFCFTRRGIERVYFNHAVFHHSRFRYRRMRCRNQ